MTCGFAAGATAASTRVSPSREAALDAWRNIASALAHSSSCLEDRILASEIAALVTNTPPPRRSEHRPSRYEPPQVKREVERAPEARSVHHRPRAERPGDRAIEAVERAGEGVAQSFE